MSQNFMDAHPEMEVYGSFMVSETHTLGGDVKVTISYNGMGEAAQNQDPAKNEVSMSARSNNTGNQAQSNCDPKTTYQTAAAQNAVKAGSAASDGIETVVVTAGLDDKGNGNGNAWGIKVRVDEFSLKAIDLSQQRVLPGAVGAYFYVNPRSPDAGSIVQSVEASVYDEEGHPVYNLVDSNYSEAWDVKQDSSETAMHEKQAPRDDLFGVLTSFPHGYHGTFRTTLRFYDGLTTKDLANYGFTPGGAPEAFSLPSVVGPVSLPTGNASAVTTREWHFNVP
jgi:hypothetical protein